MFGARHHLAMLELKCKKDTEVAHRIQNRTPTYFLESLTIKKYRTMVCAFFAKQHQAVSIDCSCPAPDDFLALLSLAGTSQSSFAAVQQQQLISYVPGSFFNRSLTEQEIRPFNTKLSPSV
jgi:hypothetical protein